MGLNQPVERRAIAYGFPPTRACGCVGDCSEASLNDRRSALPPSATTSPSSRRRRRSPWPPARSLSTRWSSTARPWSASAAASSPGRKWATGGRLWWCSERRPPEPAPNRAAACTTRSATGSVPASRPSVADVQPLSTLRPAESYAVLAGGRMERRRIAPSPWQNRPADERLTTTGM